MNGKASVAQPLLPALEGLGPQVLEALRRRFGSDAAFLRALQDADLPALTEVAGVSERRAIDWVRAVHGIQDAGTFLSTPAARKVHDEVMERLTSFAATPSGRSRLKLLGHHGDAAHASRHASQVMAHKERAASLPRDEVRRLLRKVRAPQEAPARFEPTRMVVCGDETVQERLLRQGLQRWAAIGSKADLEQAEGYDLVLYLSEEEADVGGMDNVLDLAHDARAEEVVPEATLAWVAHNRDAIQAAAQLAHLLGKPSRAAEALGLVDVAEPPHPVPLKPAVEEVRRILEARLKERVAGIAVTGADLLAAMGRGLPAAIQKAMDEVVAQGRTLLLERTGVAFQPFTAGNPITVDEGEVGRIERKRTVAARLALYHSRVRVARRIAALRPAIEAELAAWQQFDVEFALGCFALQYDLRPARWGNHLEFARSVHLDLADDPAAQRIDYHLGRTENVALVTGANSGGKTTLLEHIVQLATMARMGLPVVGEVTLPWVDELHYVTARRSLDAGAFEAFLRGFLPIVMGSRRRMVLADEVESVTELEAAGRILGFFLDRIAASDSLAVLVSHMAPQILQQCHAPLRIDGIEATGLDAENRLIVDRMPRMGVLARSTPEFIIQRLAATTSGPEQALYRELLAAFAGGNAAHPVVQVSRKGKRNPAASATA